MNIAPLPPTVAASIAGTDRAASAHVARSSAAESATKTASIKQAETVDSIDKGTASSDSEADGRQMLDTFERHTRDDEPKDDPAQDGQDNSKSDVMHQPKETPGGPTRIDFIA
jgi:hypothetical protein